MPRARTTDSAQFSQAVIDAGIDYGAVETRATPGTDAEEDDLTLADLSQDPMALYADVEIYIFNVPATTTTQAVETIHKETVGIISAAADHYAPLTIDALHIAPARKPKGNSFVDNHVKIKVRKEGWVDGAPPIRKLSALRIALANKCWEAHWSSGKNTERLTWVVCTVSAADTDDAPDIPPKTELHKTAVTIAKSLGCPTAAAFGDPTPNAGGSISNPSFHLVLASPSYAKLVLDGTKSETHEHDFGLNGRWRLSFSPYMGIVEARGPATVAMPNVLDVADDDLFTLARKLVAAFNQAHRTDIAAKHVATASVLSRYRSAHNNNWFAVTLSSHVAADWIATKLDQVLPYGIPFIVPLLIANDQTLVINRIAQSDDRLARFQRNTTDNQRSTNAAIARQNQAIERMEANQRQIASAFMAVGTRTTEQFQLLARGQAALAQGQMSLAQSMTTSHERQMSIANLDTEIASYQTEINKLNKDNTQDELSLRDDPRCADAKRRAITKREERIDKLLQLTDSLHASKRQIILAPLKTLNTAALADAASVSTAITPLPDLRTLVQEGSRTPASPTIEASPAPAFPEPGTSATVVTTGAAEKEPDDDEVLEDVPEEYRHADPATKSPMEVDVSARQTRWDVTDHDAVGIQVCNASHAPPLSSTLLSRRGQQRGGLHKNNIYNTIYTIHIITHTTSSGALRSDTMQDCSNMNVSVDMLTRRALVLLILIVTYNAWGPAWTAMAILLGQLVMVAATDQVTDTLTVMTLNCTRLSFTNTDKADALTRLVDAILPHVICLSEYGGRLGDTLPWTHSRYNVTPAQTDRSWGPTAAVLTRTDIPLIPSPPPQYHECNEGRIACADIALSVSGRSTKVTVLAVYAPTAGTSKRECDVFWDGLTGLLATRPTWVLAGDLNIYLRPIETNADQRTPWVKRSQSAYRTFLAETRGVDSWNANPTTDGNRDYTCLTNIRSNDAKAEPTYRRTIIDRVCHSPLFDTKSIRTSHTVIPSTNHRPVIADLRLRDLRLIRRQAASACTPRYRRPHWPLQAQKYDEMQNAMMDNLPVAPERLNSGSHDTLVTDIAMCFNKAASNTFTRGPKARTNTYILGPQTRQDKEIEAKLKLIRRAITAARTHKLQTLIAKVPQVKAEVLAATTMFTDSDVSSSLKKYKNKLVNRRRSLAYSPNFVKSPDDMRFATRQALKGGSLKHILVPTTVTRTPAVIDANGKMVTDGVGKLKTLTEYYDNLLHRPPVDLPANRPWLTSTHAMRVRRQIQMDPQKYAWPKLMTLFDLKDTLAKGNQRPSPGPDGVEKWMMRRAPEGLLLLVLQACNYSIQTATFPDAMKDNYMAMIYKKGDPMMPSNYRGIVFANCIQSIIASWFAQYLQTLAWDLNILSQTQIATQRRVQIGDLTLFLANIQCAAKATSKTIYALKRDHTKGFDFLSPTGFEDVVQAYGLPQSIIQFERARAENVKMQLKTQDGLGTPFFTNGQTKQGDAASPIKYTLTMSMMVHWLQDTFVDKVPVLRTVNAAHPHTTLDGIALPLLMVEAMDDSILLASSWTDLEAMAQASETFQRAYGIQTAWNSPDKTVAFTLGRPLRQAPNDIFMTVDGIRHTIPLTLNPSFLKCPINDPQQMMDRIVNVVSDFPLPPALNLSPNFIRKAINTILIPRIRPLLALQPISLNMAIQVDKYIADKICRALKLPTAAANLWTIPIQHGGFGFPAITAINNEVAFAAVYRALNHHLPPLRQAAQIVLANWTCSNNCVCPFSDTISRARPRFTRTTPQTWIQAQKGSGTTDLKLIPTDQSRLCYGAASARHLFTIAQRAGWDAVRPWHPDVLDKDLPYISELVRGQGYGDASLRQLVCSYVWPQMIAPWDASAATPRATRLMWLTQSLKCYGQDQETDDLVWATDGSHKRLAGGITSTTGAIVGPGVEKLFKLEGMDSNAGHAEVITLAAALMSAAGHNKTTIYTDYRPAVSQVTRWSQTSPNSHTHRNKMSEVWSLLHTTVNDIRPLPTVLHVKAHTDVQSPQHNANREADRLAKKAHDPAASYQVTTVAPPTALMKTYAPYIPSIGYATDTWGKHMTEATARQALLRLPPRMYMRLKGMDITRDKQVSTYYYTKSPTVWPIKLQYLIRTNQLMTPSIKYNKTISTSACCVLCNHPWCTAEHIFADCPVLQPIRDAAVSALDKRQIQTDNANGQASQSEEHQERIKTAWTQYINNNVGQHRSPLTSFWSGNISPPPPPLTQVHEKVLYAAVLRMTTNLWAQWTRRTKDSTSEDGNRTDQPIKRRDWSRTTRTRKMTGPRPSARHAPGYTCPPRPKPTPTHQRDKTQLIAPEEVSDDNQQKLATPQRSHEDRTLPDPQMTPPRTKRKRTHSPPIDHAATPALASPHLALPRPPPPSPPPPPPPRRPPLKRARVPSKTPKETKTVAPTPVTYPTMGPAPRNRISATSLSRLLTDLPEDMQKRADEIAQTLDDDRPAPADTINIDALQSLIGDGLPPQLQQTADRVLDTLKSRKRKAEERHETSKKPRPPPEPPPTA